MATTTITSPKTTIRVVEKPFVPPSTSHLTRTAYLVGNPISHSSSPFLHRTIYDSLPTPQPTWAQQLAETTDLDSFLDHVKSDPKAMGSGVTMPYKVAVIPHLDQLTPEANAIGAVNTIYFRPTGPNNTRQSHGTNTDCIGIRDAFLFNVPKPHVQSYHGKPGLVVGGGGTCRAAIYALQNFLGCDTVYIINRDRSEVDVVVAECAARGVTNVTHVSTVEQARLLAAPAAIVSAVPDFTPQTTNERTVREILAEFLSRDGPKGALLEMCYHPSPDTQISQLAWRHGWQVVGGIEAMIGQGIAQAMLWTQVEIDESVRDKARRAVRERMVREVEKKRAAEAGTTPSLVAVAEKKPLIETKQVDVSEVRIH